MEIIYTFTNNNITDIHDLYKPTWWAKDRTLEQTSNCIKGFQICIGVVNDNNKLIGFHSQVEGVKLMRKTNT